MRTVHAENETNMFSVRHALVVVLQFLSFVLVAMADSAPMALTGVVLTSISSGIGEISFLALTSLFPISVVGWWASGTGAAGLGGAGAYALLTEPALLGLSSKTALLVMLVVPILFALIWVVLLRIPEEAREPKLLEPASWRLINKERRRASSIKSLSSDRSRPEEDQEKGMTATQQPPKVDQKSRLQLSISMLRYMIPLTIVYFAEYFINQGLTELVEFDCHRGLGLSTGSQYRWYQVLYQAGVFISRSSSAWITLPYLALILLPILQLVNAALFVWLSLDAWAPHILIVFGLILYEGLIGGASYVHTFRHIHRTVPPDDREFCLGVACAGDSIGISASGLLAIPVHNAICALPPPR